MFSPVKLAGTMMLIIGALIGMSLGGAILAGAVKAFETGSRLFACIWIGATVGFIGAGIRGMLDGEFNAGILLILIAIVANYAYIIL